MNFSYPKDLRYSYDSSESLPVNFYEVNDILHKPKEKLGFITVKNNKKKQIKNKIRKIRKKKPIKNPIKKNNIDISKLIKNKTELDLYKALEQTEYYNPIKNF